MSMTYEQAREYIGGFDKSEWERKHILMLACVVEERAANPKNSANLKRTAKKYIQNHINTEHKAELSRLIAAYNSILD